MFEFAEPDAKKCPLCGTPLNPGAVICTGCGAKRKTGASYMQATIPGYIAAGVYMLLFGLHVLGAIIAGCVVLSLVNILLRKQVRWVR